MAEHKITEQKVYLSDFIIRKTWYGEELYRFVQIEPNTYMLVQMTPVKHPSVLKNYKIHQDRILEPIKKKDLLNLFFGDYDSECIAVKQQCSVFRLWAEDARQWDFTND